MDTFSQLLTRKRLLQGGLLGMAILLGVGAFQLYGTISEIGMQAFIEGVAGVGSAAVSDVQLKEQPVYRVKKKQSLLGANVVRIVSRQQPEEFLVVNGVPMGMVDTVYGKDVDLAWANRMANQLLKLRETSDNPVPVSVDIQDVKTVKAGVMEQDGREMPYWEIEVQFKLSNESASRFYQAAVIRNASPVSETSQTDTLVVGYAQKEAFQEELLGDLLNNLEFSQN